MKRYSRIVIACLICNIAAAQRLPSAIKVTYEKSSNGKVLENQDQTVIFSDANRTILTTENTIANKAEIPFEQSVVDRKANNYVQFSELNGKRTIMTIDSTSLAKQSFEKSSETKIILGYKCLKAKAIINSNTIELWYTNDLNLKGAPTVLGQNLGLVLEMTRNGNYTVLAKKIDKIKEIPGGFPNEKGALKVDVLTYRDILWKSRFTTINIFRKEIINFSDDAKSSDSILRFAKGTIIVKRMKIPEITNATRIFIDATEQSNGDAYDRTGSIFIIPEDQEISFFKGLNSSAKSLPIYDNGNGKQYQGVVRTTNYSPLLELMRFFTPFGISQYNTIKLKNKTWQDSVYYRQDISDLLPALSGKEVWIGANIGNYDKGGHRISVNITLHPEADQQKESDFILPLFNTNNVMEMAGQEYATMFNTEKGLEVTFSLQEDIRNAQLRYITTGHGGWENGDEYLQKKNTLFLDGQEVFAFIPWRMDCGSFRSYNPASGNFPNGLSSSDYSRSNWCPGTVTNPIFIALGDLKAGQHTIRVNIPQGAPEGTSFSSWNVSGVLIGETGKSKESSQK